MDDTEKPILPTRDAFLAELRDHNIQDWLDNDERKQRMQEKNVSKSALEDRLTREERVARLAENFLYGRVDVTDEDYYNALSQADLAITSLSTELDALDAVQDVYEDWMQQEITADSTELLLADVGNALYDDNEV